MGVERLAAAAMATFAALVMLSGCGGDKPSDGTPKPRPWAVLVPSGLDLDPGLTRVRISIDSGRCNPPRSALDRVEVDERPDAVEITPFVRPDPSQGVQDACLSYIPATVDLEKPLGDRRLIQGTTGKAPERFQMPASTRLDEEEARRLRVAAIAGARVDFSAVGSPPGFERCFLAGFGEALTTTTLASLVDLRKSEGNAGVARALNGIGAPVAAKCGGKANVPELVTSARLLGQ